MLFLYLIPPTPLTVISDPKLDDTAAMTDSSKLSAVDAVSGAVGTNPGQPETPVNLAQVLHQCAELLPLLWISILGKILQLPDRKSKRA